MDLQIESSTGVNSVFIIKSVKPNEGMLTKHFVTNLESFLGSIGALYELFEPSSHDELSEILDAIAESARAGARPIVQFYMHGNPSEGLYIAKSGEYYDRQTLSKKLRLINIITENNLCVISAVCYGLNVIRYNNISDAVMAYVVIAPQHKVYIDFVENDLFGFYEHVFNTCDLYGAYEKFLINNMSLFHYEKTLAIVMARYFKSNCLGDGLEARIDRLLADAKRAGTQIDSNNEPRLRALLKQEISPSRDVFDRYALEFLVGRRPGFTFEQIMAMVEGLDKE